jgi:hypothetical protein
MIRNQELLLPSHEHGSPVPIVDGHEGFLRLSFRVLESREPRPMDHVFMLRRAPILRQEAIPTPNYLGIEIGREFWPVVRQALYPQVSAQGGGGKVNVLYPVIDDDECGVRQISDR